MRARHHFALRPAVHEADGISSEVVGFLSEISERVACLVNWMARDGFGLTPRFFGGVLICGLVCRR
jgi:hypothetical protein